MTTPGQAVQKNVPSHRVGVDVRLVNHDGPQDPGHPQENPGAAVRPSTTPHGHIPGQRVASQRETPHSVQAALFPTATHGKTFHVHGQMLGLASS